MDSGPSIKTNGLWKMPGICFSVTRQDATRSSHTCTAAAQHKQPKKWPGKILPIDDLLLLSPNDLCKLSPCCTLTEHP